MQRPHRRAAATGDPSGRARGQPTCQGEAAVRRIRLRFALGVEVEFADRERAIRQLEDVAARGTRLPLVVFGPEGCGKTALFRQAMEVFKDHGYTVIYVDPLAETLRERIAVSSDARDVAVSILERVEPTAARLVDAAIEIAARLLELKRRRIAIILDDVFQAIGLDKAETLVKALLNLIEYPPREYESIVVIVGSSEGATRERIGRHGWAETRLLWNMPREGLMELYHRLPGDKPSPNEAWTATGGNPRYLSILYERAWNTSTVAQMIAENTDLYKLIAMLTERQLKTLKASLEDPDTLMETLRNSEDSEDTTKLISMLIEKNLIMRMASRDPWLWIDTPPPEKDPELGIGRFHAWQTPLHREAVRRVLAELGA